MYFLSSFVYSDKDGFAAGPCQRSSLEVERVTCPGDPSSGEQSFPSFWPFSPPVVKEGQN